MRRVNVFGCLRWLPPPFLRSIVLSYSISLCHLQQPGRPHLGRLATSCDERSNDRLPWPEIKITSPTINTTTRPAPPQPRTDRPRSGLPSGSLLRALDLVSSTTSSSIYGAPADRFMQANFELKRRKRFRSLHTSYPTDDVSADRKWSIVTELQRRTSVF